ICRSGWWRRAVGGGVRGNRREVMKKRVLRLREFVLLRETTPLRPWLGSEPRALASVSAAALNFAVRAVALLCYKLAETLWGSLVSCSQLSIGPLPRSLPGGGGNQPPRRLSTCPTSMAHAVCNTVFLMLGLVLCATVGYADNYPRQLGIDAQ